MRDRDKIFDNISKWKLLGLYRYEDKSLISHNQQQMNRTKRQLSALSEGMGGRARTLAEVVALKDTNNTAIIDFSDHSSDQFIRSQQHPSQVQGKEQFNLGKEDLKKPQIAYQHPLASQSPTLLPQYLLRLRIDDRTELSIRLAKHFVEYVQPLNIIRRKAFSDISQYRMRISFRHIITIVLKQLSRLLILNIKSLTLTFSDEQIDRLLTPLQNCKKWMQNIPLNTFLKLIKNQFEISHENIYVYELLALLKVIQQYQRYNFGEVVTIKTKLVNLKTDKSKLAIEELVKSKRKKLQSFQRHIAEMYIESKSYQYIRGQLFKVHPSVVFSDEDISKSLSHSMLLGIKKISFYNRRIYKSQQFKINLQYRKFQSFVSKVKNTCVKIALLKGYLLKGIIPDELGRMVKTINNFVGVSSHQY